jgi:hypothetical protein
LKNQATAHFHQALRLDPSREVAWKHLGYRKAGGRWQRPELLAAAKAEGQEHQKANKHWKPILEKLRTNLKSKDKARRAEAEKALTQITDRRALPMVWSPLGLGDAALQEIAVQVLAQIDDPSAARALVLLGVLSGSGDVRGRVIGSLRRRDPREFASMLIEMIQQPIAYGVKPVRGPGQRGELLIKGQGTAANLKRLCSSPAGPSITPQPGDRVSLDENGLPVIVRAEPVTQTAFMDANQLFPTFQQPAPMAQQKSQLIKMAMNSGLGLGGQKLASVMLSAYANEVKNADFFKFQSPFFDTVTSTIPINGPVNSASMFSFTIGVGYEIPVGRMAVEAQTSAVAAQQQPQNDTEAIKQ